MKQLIAKFTFWLVLAIPAGLMIRALFTGEVPAMELLHPSGEMSVRLMILAMLIGPLIDIFGPNRFFRTWMRARRNLGVAAFCYGLLHLVIYLYDMGRLDAILSEALLPSIWTGWLSFAALLIIASVSNDSALRRLGKWWKRIQTLAYAAFALGIIHWLLLEWSWGPALVHFAPLFIVWLARPIGRKIRQSKAARS